MSPKFRLIICNESVDTGSQPIGKLSIAPAPAETEEEKPIENIDADKRGSRVLPAVVGLMLVLFFRFLAHSVYGSASLKDQSWIDTLTWIMIMIGVVISLMQFISDCFACRLLQTFRLDRLRSRLCSGCA